MAIGSPVSNTNLEFWWDMNSRKSFKGKPTTNLCYHMNSVHQPKETISFHQYSTNGTFNTNHPGRLIVNTPTTTRSTAVNTGVNSGNWESTHHGYWKWDFQRKKAVFFMNDIDGQWKANSFNLGQSFNNYSLSAGDTFSLSWDQWTSRIDKNARAGVYMRNTSGSNGFHAGQATQSTAFNTIPFKWQRVYNTFTVPSNMNMDHNLSIYCYGHYTGRGVIKMDNLQFEAGNPSYFVQDNKGNPASSRSSTEGLIDVTGNNTITINDLNYLSDGTFNFTGSSHYASVSGSLATDCDGNVTMMAWFKQLSRNGPHQTIVCTNTGYRQGIKLMSAYHTQGGAFWVANADGTDSTLLNTGSGTLENTGIHHLAATRNSSTGALKIYLDGVLVNTATGSTGDVSNTSTSNARIGLEYHSGSYGANATYYDTRVYSRELSASEILSIYNSTKSQYV